MTTIAAHYYDGQSSRRHTVVFTIAEGAASVSGEHVSRSAPLNSIKISEPMGAAPRLITFPDGAFCEIHDHDALSVLLAQHHYRDRLHIRWQFDPKAILFALTLCIAMLVLAYRWGVPILAEHVAANMPDTIVNKLSHETLAAIDEHVVGPSKLPQARQAALAQRFRAMQPPDEKPIPHTLVFRQGRHLGANAIALPSGTIVVTDELVKQAKHDEEILGVLAHELGHVRDRHGIRSVLQSSIVGLATAWYFGDISTAVAGVSTALLQSRYSREFEEDADLYAARMLTRNNVSPVYLADILERMESAEASRTTSAADYFSTHPAIKERARYLRAFTGKEKPS